MAPRKNRQNVQTANVDTTTTKDNETVNESTATATATDTPEPQEVVKAFPKMPNATSKGLSKILNDWSESAMRAALASDDDMLKIQSPMFPAMFQSMLSNDTLKRLGDPISVLMGFNATIAKVGRIEIDPISIPILRRANQFDVECLVDVLDTIRVYRLTYVSLVDTKTEQTSADDTPAFNLDNVAELLANHFKIDRELADDYAAKLFTAESSEESDLVLIVGPTINFSKDSNSGKESVENCLTLADISSESGKLALSSRLSYFGGTLAEYRKAIGAAKSSKSDDSSGKSDDSSGKSAQDTIDKAADELLESMK